MLRVIVKRGPAKPDLYFGPERKARARQRAESLAWLHCGKVTEEGDTIIVDATEYYNN